MTKPDVVQFRKQDFEVSVIVEDADEKTCSQLADAIYRLRPSRLDNLLEMEVCHRADQSIHQTIQLLCDKGINGLTLKTVYPIPRTAIANDPRAYMEFVYGEGKVVDQWTEMSRHEGEEDELMVDVIKVAFEKKMVTNCIWGDEASTPCLHIVAGIEHKPEA